MSDAHNDTQNIHDLIDRYAKQADRLTLSIRGLTREDLLALPVPGTWSIQQIILHLLDSELIMTDRAKCIIAEDEPKYSAFDESRFARSLCYDQQSAEDAATMFALNRRNFAKVLRNIPASAFGRAGIHSEAGRQTLQAVIDKAVAHVEHHMKFLVEKREKLGKIMW